MVYTAAEAAQELAGEDVSVEIVDLRSVMPWDKAAVLESVRKTSKVLVLHEDTRTGGFGAEIAATIAELAFEDLDAPVKRLAAPDTAVPFSPPPEPATQAAADESVAAASEGVGDVAPSAPAPERPAAPPPSENGKTFVSPVVARIASEHGVDPNKVQGTGAGGRVTKKDILAFIESGGAQAAPAAPAAAAPAPAAPAPAAATPAPAAPAAPAEARAGEP